MNKLFFLLLMTLCTSTTLSAHIDDAQTSITFSVLDMQQGISRLNGEGRVTENASVLFYGGGGQLEQNAKNPLYLLLGAGYRIYLIGNFMKGFHIGGAAIGSFSTEKLDLSAGIGSGIAAETYLGYKYTAKMGFTAEVHVGGAYRYLSGLDESGAAARLGKLGLLTALNVGWTF